MRYDALPLYTNGARSTPWLGVLLLVVIEGTVFVCLMTSYFYLRLMADRWPPDGTSLPDLALPTAGTAAMLLLVPVARAAEVAIARGLARRSAVALGAGALLTLAYLATSAVDTAQRDYPWNRDAYASLVWTLGGYGMVHALVLLLLLGGVGLLTARGHYDRDRRVGVQIAALYGYFVAASALLTYLTVYVSPYVLGSPP